MSRGSCPRVKYKASPNIVSNPSIEVARKLAKECPDINYDAAAQQQLELEVQRLRELMREFNEDLNFMLAKSQSTLINNSQKVQSVEENIRVLESLKASN